MIQYAPVADFSVELTPDGFIGFAAPQGRGQPPCLLKLTSDGEPIAYTRAAGYSQAAEAAGKRRGWCAYALPGRSIAQGVGDSVQIRCGATDRVLSQVPFDPSLFERPAPGVTQISVTDLVELARHGESCRDVEQLAEFGRFHLERHGVYSFLHATYQMFFGRDADNGVIHPWLNCDDQMAEVQVCLDGIFESEEYLAKSFHHLPGPFQTQFRYDRDYIDL